MEDASLRVLCLHDCRSSAEHLKNDLSRLGNRLYKNHGKIDLVYVNSPLVVDGELGLRSWHYGKNEDDKYGGLDASLLFLRQIWRSQPFWGAVGVGQGASIAAMLILTLLPDGDVRESSPPQFSVFIDGESMISETERLVDENQLSCLHLSSAKSCSVLPAQFGGESIQTNSKKDILNAIGRFICVQRKRTSGTVALRSKLHSLELQASDVVAQRIKDNPPAPLMAVIRPRQIAGWHGYERRRPDEEGGGAPCPPEFLLNRSKRRNDEACAPGRNYPTDIHAKCVT